MTDADSHRKLAANPPDEVGSDQPSGLLELPQRQKVVLVMDLVESVRLMAANERAVIDHWRGFVQHATTDVLPRHRGRMVKSLGDGIMAEFDSARDGTNAALALQRFFDRANATLPPDQQLYLRAGLNATHVFVDDIDIYGSGVNLAARVAGLAGPGEVMVTAEVRDGLTDGLDAMVEDMGECYLKHVAEPVRAYRVGAAGPRSILTTPIEMGENLRPAIAVVPFQERLMSPSLWALGELIADGVICRLSRNQHLRVVSRLSTTRLKDSELPVQDMGASVGASFVLSGSYTCSGSSLIGHVELTHASTAEVIFLDRFAGDVRDLFELESEICSEIATKASMAISSVQAQQALTQPVPTLSSYTLLLGGINLMHQSSTRSFGRARAALEALAERHSRNGSARAWLGMWHVLSATRGWASSNAAQGRQAIGLCEQAINAEPNNSLALAVHGFACLHLGRDTELALASLREAVAVNPNDALALLFLSVAQAFKGDSESAVAAANAARSLSPIDPWAYYYDCLASSAYISARKYGRAIELCQQSLRQNRLHPPTLRSMIAAQVGAGDLAGARASAKTLLEISPNFTVADFLRQSASANHLFGQTIARSLAEAGIPQSN